MHKIEIKEQEKCVINTSEKYLLRKGDIITPIGIFRATMANSGILEREHFNFLVKRNYFLEKESELPEHISQKITHVWSNLKNFLEDLDIIEEFGEKKIKIRDPKECFSI